MRNKYPKNIQDAPVSMVHAYKPIPRVKVYQKILPLIYFNFWRGRLALATFHKTHHREKKI